MFIETKDKSVIVIGGGNIAGRRVQTLSRFSFKITVISKQTTDELQKLCDEARIRLIKENFDPDKPEAFADLFSGASMVLACTDDRNTNAHIGAFCREHGIPVNVCDAQDESTFWFPAIALNDELTMGLVGNGRSHETVRSAAAELRRVIEEKKY